MGDYLKPYSYPVSTGRAGGAPQTVATKQQSAASTSSFQDILQKTLTHMQPQPQALTLSRHAQARVQQRQLPLSQADFSRLEQAVEKADRKGLHDTLILMDNTAYIVNIPNRVVVTVMDKDAGEDNIFTNIDGAVIL